MHEQQEEREYLLKKKEVRKIVQLLRQSGLQAFVCGSFALCLHAGKLVGSPQDIDLAFVSRAAHDRAVAMLESEHQYKMIKQSAWESDQGDESINTKMLSPEGVEFDLSYFLGDIQVALDPEHTIEVEGEPIPMLSLEDLKRSYQIFGHEKPGAEVKIVVIDDLERET